MPQAEAPREFKFVGAYSRKRRRRNAPGLGTGPKSPAANKGKPVKAAQTSKSPSREAQASPAATSPARQADVCCSNQDSAFPSFNESVSEETNLDWASSTFLNPFLDPGPSFMTCFDQINDHSDFPSHFGPDVPLAQFDSLTSNDSVQDHLVIPAIPTKGNEVAPEPRSINDILLPSLSPKDAPSNLSLTMKELLTRYDEEFCVMPLTHDFEANPFRHTNGPHRGSQLLLQCILALSYKHISQDTGGYDSEARMHKNKALRMLHELESASHNSPLEANTLDSVLILITLDCATSAYGPWTWHLKRAHKMIQATEALEIQKTPRMQARIEMLVWWDVTLALTSRQGCIFSEATMINLFNHHGSSNETFYSVSGCPEALFHHMIRLGSYAREFEIVANMTCAKFDMDPVLELEREIKEWTSLDYSNLSNQYTCLSSSKETSHADVADEAHDKEDMHHCAEAWRYGLLTYIGRVFRWQFGQPVASILGFLARKTLNHVSACRKSSMLQKQLLLPVFLAGCETSDEHLRQAARDYCHWWNDRTRYGMFLTTNALLEEVWSSHDPQAWWGLIIDKKSRSGVGSGGEARQYLFG